MGNGTYWTERLATLGFPSYDAYLASPHWQTTRRRYLESDRPQECVCGETDSLHIHHLTYARLGNERLTDLLALCSRCHRMVHILAARGLLRIDLDGFTSATRAADYAADTRPMRERAVAERPRRRELRYSDDHGLTRLIDHKLKAARRRRIDVEPEIEVLRAVLASLKRKMAKMPGHEATSRI